MNGLEVDLWPNQVITVAKGFNNQILFCYFKASSAGRIDLYLKNYPMMHQTFDGTRLSLWQKGWVVMA